jgi:NAD+ synthase (glutamine-hydrolysing)
MRIAIGQINPTIGHVSENTRKIIEYIDMAMSRDADLVVFPEMAIIGYPPMDLLEHKKLIYDNLDCLQKIVEASKGISVICGYVDFDAENPPMLYNAAAFIHDGELVSRHYKTLLPTYDVFDEQRYFSPAKEQHSVMIQGTRMGVTICEDIWNDMSVSGDRFMENRRYLVDPVQNLLNEGTECIVNISASPYVKGKNAMKWLRISRLAELSGMPVVYVNQVGGNDSLIFDGNSFMVNGKGEFSAMAVCFEEELLLIDMDKENHIPFPREHDMEDIRRALVLGIRDYVRKCGFTRVVLGLSGGIDSALTATLATEALGPENVMGITMPSKYSSKGSVDDSFSLGKNLGIAVESVPIKNMYDLFLEELSPLMQGLPMDVTEENLQARIRSNILMAVSNKFGRLLLTTGNKSELAMGYCTIYGDMAGGLAVLSDLPKTLVYSLSRHINNEREIIPWETIEKPPSAELRENQKDQDSLPPYELLDQVLELYIERKYSASEIIDAGFQEEMVRRILKTVDRNEYKRRQAPPGIKVTSKAFGIGRRIPIAQKYEQ